MNIYDMNSDQRRHALQQMVQRQGDHDEREQAHRPGYWVDDQRAVSIVARALEEEADHDGRRLLGYEPVSDEDVKVALASILDARYIAERRELTVLHAARVRGLSWEEIARLLDVGFSAADRVTPAQAKSRYATLKRKYPASARAMAQQTTSAPAAAPTEPS